MKTKIVNDTSVDIILKERSESVQRKLKDPLKPGELFTLDVDPNATYREYHISFQGEADTNPVLKFDSDDLKKNSRISIREKPNESGAQKPVLEREGGTSVVGGVPLPEDN
jgi:hypothetical protein